MVTIEEIKQALLQFSPADLALFRAWFAKFDADVWDSQFEQDVAAGRLDSLGDEALQDLHQERCTALCDSVRRPVSGVATVSCQSRSRS